MDLEVYMGIRINMKKLRECKKGCQTVWTVKYLDIKCKHKKVQPECERFCCGHCPKSFKNEVETPTSDAPSGTKPLTIDLDGLVDNTEESS